MLLFQLSHYWNLKHILELGPWLEQTYHEFEIYCILHVCIIVSKIFVFQLFYSKIWNFITIVPLIKRRGIISSKFNTVFSVVSLYSTYFISAVSPWNLKHLLQFSLYLDETYHYSKYLYSDCLTHILPRYKFLLKFIYLAGFRAKRTNYLWPKYLRFGPCWFQLTLAAEGMCFFDKVSTNIMIIWTQLA